MKILCQESETRYRNSLRPGETFIKRNGFYYDDDRAKFGATCDELRKKAHGIIDDVRAEQVKTMARCVDSVFTTGSAEKTSMAVSMAAFNVTADTASPAE